MSVIAFFLAETADADRAKVLTMALFHDSGEARSGDQNWLHKRYVTVHEDEILEDVAKKLSSTNTLIPCLKEYNMRESLDPNL